MEFLKSLLLGEFYFDCPAWITDDMKERLLTILRAAFIGGCSQRDTNRRKDILLLIQLLAGWSAAADGQ